MLEVLVFNTSFHTYGSALHSIIRIATTRRRRGERDERRTRLFERKEVAAFIPLPFDILIKPLLDISVSFFWLLLEWWHAQSDLFMTCEQRA